MLIKLQNFFNTCFKFIVPNYCEKCKTILETNLILCDFCKSEELKPVISSKIKIGENQYIFVHALTAYDGIIKKFTLSKFYKKRMPFSQIADLMWNYSSVKNIPFDIIVPIPIHWTRELKRGFNQSEIIAQRLSVLSKKPVINLINRNKATTFQSSNKKNKRLENVSNCFKLESNFESIVREKTILIVDDLLTTGSTMKAVAIEIQKMFPKEIFGMVACKSDF